MFVQHRRTHFQGKNIIPRILKHHDAQKQNKQKISKFGELIMELHFLTHGYFTIVSFTTIYPAMTRSTAFIFALQRPKPSSNVKI
jgi:hypothetical protein